ncbi:MAG: TOMM system kinase/cyclase fusion protein [Roseivirga sp.]
MSELTKTQSPGQAILGDYQLLDQIGQGGNGLVYRARHIRTKQLVAVKTIRLDKTQDNRWQNTVARFEREAELCARINHPNIVRLLDKGYSGAQEPFAVFELVEGQTLKDYITLTKGLTPDLTKEIMTQVLDALHCAHAQGIIHRDLKPHNIMVSQTATRPHVKILDFGIGAFSRDFRSVEYETLTLTQEVLGTPNYSAPEQLRGEPPTERTDLYAWGLILMECMTGKSLIKGGSIAEVFQQQLMPSEITLPAFVLGHPLAALLRRVLRKNPQHRSASAKLILSELTKINFNSLHVPVPNAKEEDLDLTAINQLSSGSASASRKQVTVLCSRLSLVSSNTATLDLETLDAIGKDQLNLSKDIAMRYGGHIGPVISNHMVVYFGYPETYDTDARRAGMAALELMNDARRRGKLLHEVHGLDIDLRITLHTGTMLIFSNQAPEGNVVNTAFELLYQTSPGTVITTGLSRKLLEPYLEFSEPTQTLLADGFGQVFTYQVIRERSSGGTTLRYQSLERPLTGRATELKALKDAWLKSDTGGTSLLLEGQAGIGKSRLLHELKSEVVNNGDAIRECRCLPEYQNSALYPFLTMLRAHWHLDHQEDAKTKVSKLSRVLGELGYNDHASIALLSSWLSLPVEHTESLEQKTPEEQKQILYDILRSALWSMGKSAPLLLIIEDLHWMDPSSLEFTGQLLDELKAQHICLLATTRPGSPHTLPDVTTIKLAPLQPDDTSQIIKEIVRGEHISSEAVQYILRKTDGIPLYAEELTSMLLEEGFLTQQEGSFQLIADLDQQTIPGTLQDLLNARLDRLGPVKETAQMAATIGREFDYQVLSKAMQKEEAALLQDLKVLQQADLIGLQSQSEDKYIFRHALISDAAYEGMTTTFKKEVHLKIADTLETHFADTTKISPMLLAEHLHKGEAYERAIQYGIKAAESAVDKAASEEAIINAGKVLNWTQWLAKESAVSPKLELCSILTSAHMQKGGWAAPEVLHYSEMALELLRDSKRFNDLICHLWWKVLGGVVGGENDSLTPICEEMDEHTPRLIPVNQSAVRCAQAFVTTALGQGDVWQTVISQCREALQFFDKASTEEKAGHENTFGFSVPVFARALMAMAVNVSGNKDQAIKEVNQMLADARDSEHSPSIGIALMYVAELYKLHGNRKEVKKHSGELVELSKKYQMPVYEAYGQMQLDWANNSLENEAGTYTALHNEGSLFSLAHYQSQYAETYAHRGDFKSALAKAEQCIAMDESIKHQYYLARLYFLKGKYQWRLGLESKAVLALEKAQSIARLQGSEHYINEIEAFMKTVL